MAETLVENKVCEACGADVRSGSLFCYNCGGAVSLDLPESEKKTVREALLSEDLADNRDLKTKPLDSEVTQNVVLKPIEKPSNDELLEKFADKSKENRSIQEEAKLKSAANMRRKAKKYQKKTLEVVWEEPENAPNKWFPIVAVILILFVVAIFYLAMYLK